MYTVYTLEVVQRHKRMLEDTRHDTLLFKRACLMSPLEKRNVGASFGQRQWLTSPLAEVDKIQGHIVGEGKGRGQFSQALQKTRSVKVTGQQRSSENLFSE